MKLPLNWLKKFVDVNESIQAVADRFYSLGFEVESIEGDILDLEITPNRGDCLSILGLAREYAASTNQALKYSPIANNIEAQSNKININVESKNILGYSSYCLNNLALAESPNWLKEELAQVDIEPINLVVDATNYVMMELGVPLHAFDLAKISGSQITFRESTTDEKIKTLNGKIYTLDEGMLVAQDESDIIDLVGLQGGLSSGVSQTSKDIFLHSIIIDSKNIRATSKKLKLTTPASYRFERGVDMALIEQACLRCIQIINQFTSSTNAKVKSLDNKVETKQVNFKNDLVEKLSGTKIDDSKISQILNNLGFSVNGDIINVPSYRQRDISFPQDIVEEIIRINNYNNLTKTSLPIGQSNPLPTHQKWLEQSKLTHKLLNLGFSEVMTYSFTPNKENNSGLVKIINPLSSDHAYLRDSLIPMLINVANNNSYYPKIKLFEIGNIYQASAQENRVALISTEKIDLNDVKVIAPNQLKNKRQYYVWEGEVSTLNQLLPDLKPDYVTPILPYRPISKFPPIIRDIAIVIPEDVAIDTIRNFIFEINQYILIIELFDEFRSEKIGLNKKSIALRITFDNPQETMTLDYVNKIMVDVENKLKNHFQAIIR